MENDLDPELRKAYEAMLEKVATDNKWFYGTVVALCAMGFGFFVLLAWVS